jgi:hypothetical protein
MNMENQEVLTAEEMYAHLGAIAAITEELYFARNE